MAHGQEWLVGNPRPPYGLPPGWVDLVIGTLWNKVFQNDPAAWSTGIPKFDLVIIGQIYCNSDEIGGTTMHFEDPQELYNLYVKHGDDAAAAVKELLDMDCEPTIYGFVVREI